MLLLALTGGFTDDEVKVSVASTAFAEKKQCVVLFVKKTYL